MTPHDAMAPSPLSGRRRLAQLRMISFAFIGVIPLLAAVTFVMVPGESLFAAPDAISVILPLAAGAAAVLGIVLIGNRVAPLPATTPLAKAQHLGMARFQVSFFLRLAFAEFPALVGVAAVFLGGAESAIPFAIGGAIALALHLFAAVPKVSTVTRVERRLDANGARSRLAAAFGLTEGFGPTARDDYTGGAVLH